MTQFHILSFRVTQIVTLCLRVNQILNLSFSKPNFTRCPRGWPCSSPSLWGWPCPSSCPIGWHRSLSVQSVWDAMGCDGVLYQWKFIANDANIYAVDFVYIINAFFVNNQTCWRMGVFQKNCQTNKNIWFNLAIYCSCAACILSSQAGKRPIFSRENATTLKTRKFLPFTKKKKCLFSNWSVFVRGKQWLIRVRMKIQLSNMTTHYNPQWGCWGY